MRMFDWVFFLVFFFVSWAYPTPPIAAILRVLGECRSGSVCSRNTMTIPSWKALAMTCACAVQRVGAAALSLSQRDDEDPPFLAALERPGQW